jgi:hypothetical protein
MENNNDHFCKIWGRCFLLKYNKNKVLGGKDLFEIDLQCIQLHRLHRTLHEQDFKFSRNLSKLEIDRKISLMVSTYDEEKVTFWFCKKEDELVGSLIPDLASVQAVPQVKACTVAMAYHYIQGCLLQWEIL